MLKLNSVKMRLLTSTAVALFVSSSGAAANDLNGVDTGAGSIYNLVGGAVNQVANVTTVDLTTVLDGVEIWTTTGNVDVIVDRAINATLEGVTVNTSFFGNGGDITVSGTGSITSTTTTGIWALVDDGNVDIGGVTGGINGLAWGILVNQYGSWAGATPSGTIDIGQSALIGNIVSGALGIQVVQAANAAGDGAINISTADVDAGTWGITTTAWTATTTIDTSAGTVDAGGYGIIHTSTSGNVDVKTADITSGATSVYTTTIDGDHAIDSTAGALDSLTWGIAAFATGTGDVAVKSAKIDSVNTAIWTANTTGTTLVETNDTITSTGNFGIYSTSTTGNIKQDVKSGDVTGFTDGINAISGTGHIDIDIGAGSTITGTVNGIEAITNGAGNIDIDIASGATVQAQTFGLATGNVLGTATTTNLGTIKDTTDTGAASDIGGDAYWSYAGNGVLNNESGGVITGRVHSNGSTTFKFNNKAGSTWNAGTLVNGFGAAGDEINNAGLINIRNGVTGLTALDNLNNEAGGVIDMQYGEDADDIVNGIVNFNAKDGSKLKFDVDFAAASDGDDHTSYGAGKGDTIYTVAAAPSGVSLVNINPLNKTTQGNLVATSGSIALVNSGGSNLADPGLGGLATMVASDNYTFENDPTTGAVKFMLVEDGNGGVYLQWAPNVTEESLGAYVGGSMSNPDSVGGAINGAMGGLAGVGAGFGGGPGGGGVAGSIADAAASAAGQNGTCGPSKDMLHGTYSTDSHVWMSAEGQGANYDGGGSGWNGGTALGIERDIGGNMGLGCGDVAIGMFGFIDAYSNANAAGMQEGNAKGGGLYAKAASQNGLYASVLGAVGFGDVDLTNNVFGSTAQQGSMNYLGNLTVGYSSSISDTLTMDARVFGTIGHVDGNGFTDSAGIVVDGTNATSLTIGAMVGLSANIADNTSAFINLGAKYIALSQDATAFGTSVSGTHDTVVGAIEAGIVATISESATFTATGFGDLSTDAVSYGGNLTLNFKL